MVAIEAVLGINREAVFEVLKLPKEIQHAFAADSGFGKQARPGRIGRGFLTSREGHHVSDRGLLPRHHDTHSSVARASGDCSDTKDSERMLMPVACLRPDRSGSRLRR